MRDMMTFHALNRFGLGPAPGEAETVGDDPRGWVKAQIGARDLSSTLSRFKGSAEILADIHAARLNKPNNLSKAMAKAYRRSFANEIMARARAMANSTTPFAERMVAFWSNHFTVSTTKPIIGPAIPAYEREAIFPNVFGRFSDMLKAVCRHPVMLSYLDNTVSMGPQSRAGKWRRARTGTDKMLNENLAREILELHTLGVNGGYTQRDVIELAKAITGWSHGGLRLRFERRPVHGNFEYKPLFHEPGPKTVMGRTYRENGDREGLEILDDLARHPSTARFIATKLVRHFVADDPGEETVARIAAVFRNTEGDLAEVSRAIVDLDAAWATPLSKVKSHQDYVISVLRATGNHRARARDVLQPLREMAQMPFTAPSPAGWGDRASDWIAPEALMRRIEWARRYAAALPASLVPEKELDNLIGPVAGAAIRTEVRHAPAVRDAMAMILASPEFQRR